MNRAEALALVEKHVSEINLRRHMLATGVVMRALAERLSEDADIYEITGLLHDLDYSATVGDPSKHALVTAEMLAYKDLQPEVIHAIKAHNNKVPIESKLDLAMYATDPVTGFLTACALIRQDKRLSGVDVAFGIKRWKEKRFAAGANREAMARCEGLGLTREEFLSISLKAMQGISGELGL